MANSNPKRRGQKPTKPQKDFPLFPHATNRWAKKVRGKLYYFGSTKDDPLGEAALARWLEVKDDLFAGRTPRRKAVGVTISDLCNHFLTWKQGIVQSGELTQRTFAGYHDACRILVNHFGKDRPVLDLRPTDFENLRAAMAGGWGACSSGKRDSSHPLDFPLWVRK